MTAALTKPPRRLVALDVETADDAHVQVCQIALVLIEDGQIVDEWSSLVCPPSPPTAASTAVHGLSWDRLKDEPCFFDVWPAVLGRLDGADALVAHWAQFDRKAIEGNCASAKVQPPALPWICTVELGRLAWPKPTVVADHRLPTLAAHLGIPLQHHEALSDARACARIYLAACEKMGQVRDTLNAANPLAKASPVVSQERQGIDDAHRWAWVSRDGYASLAINGSLLLEAVYIAPMSFDVKVYLGTKIAAFHGGLCNVAVTERAVDSLMLDALRSAVVVAQRDRKVTLSAETWKKIAEGRPTFPIGRAAA